MPMQSKAQNRFMHAHENDRGPLGAVARKFVADSHGQKVKKLPERVKKKKPAHRAVFGSLSPTQSGHYDGDMPE